MIQDALAALPDELTARFRAFLAEPQEPVEQLSSELDRYLALLHQLAPRIRGLDPAQVEHLTATARGLLHLPELTAEGSTLVNAAVRYFLHKEQDYDDNTAVLTLDDDVEVFNAVSQSLDRPDLVIPRRRP